MSHTLHCMMRASSVSWLSTVGENSRTLPARKEHTAASSVDAIRVSTTPAWSRTPASGAALGWCWSMSRKAKRRSAIFLSLPSTVLRVTLSSTWSFSSTISVCSSSSSTSSRVTIPTMSVRCPLEAITTGSAVDRSPPSVSPRMTAPASSAGRAGICPVGCEAVPCAESSGTAWISTGPMLLISIPPAPAPASAGALSASGTRCTRARCVRLVLNVLSILSRGVLWLTQKMGRPHAAMISDTGSSSSASTRTRSLVLSTPTRLLGLPS
mmetsp:Transcript_2864/g.8443  ORF Transcript_2864/g.8443 Transcript_2864/m.8443 type:complete len:268 (-) Transcript_2864:875-1678(-)